MRRRYTHRSLRHMKTTQERRANGRRNILEIDGYRIKLRSKRNRSNLPDVRWDFWMRIPKCWKNHRETQYKTNKYSVFFDWIPEREMFNMGERLYVKQFFWDSIWYDAYEVETGKRVRIEWNTLCEWPIKN